jgi:hypothetical protein
LEGDARERARGYACGTLSGIDSSIKEGTMETSEKVRENRLRRMAERQGYKLRKSGRRDPRAWDYGTYQIVHSALGSLAVAQKSSREVNLTIDEVERWLTTDKNRRTTLLSGTLQR